MNEQIDLFQRVTETEIEQFRQLLLSRGWQTRRQVGEALGWPDRKVRAVAETMGTDIVRGQRGFKLTSQINRDDLPQGLQASDAAISQGKRMIRYGIGIRKRLHSLIR